MTGAEDRARVKRLQYWIAGLTLIPGSGLLVAGLTRQAAGYAIGGALVLLNLMGTERSVRAFVDGGGAGRVAAALLYTGKLAATAAVIAAVLITGMVSPLALMLGITTLLMALVFDFFIFPRKIGQDS